MMAGQSVGMVTSVQPVAGDHRRTRRAGDGRAGAPERLMASTPRGAPPAPPGCATSWRARVGAASGGGPAGRGRAGERGPARSTPCGPATCWSWWRPRDSARGGRPVTRLRVGEGIVGLVSRTGQGDEPRLTRRTTRPSSTAPKPGEDAFSSLLAVPIRRAGRTLGVIGVQNRTAAALRCRRGRGARDGRDADRRDAGDGGVPATARRGARGDLPRRFPGSRLAPGLAIGPVVLHGGSAAPAACWPTTALAEQARLDARGRADAARHRRPDRGAAAARATHRANHPRGLPPGGRRPGWLKTGEGGDPRRALGRGRVQRVAAELRDRMRRFTDPYLRERMADLEDLANRAARGARREAAASPMGAAAARRDPARPPPRPGRPARLAGARHRRRGDRGGQPGRPCGDPGAGARPADAGRRARHPRHGTEEGDCAILDADEDGR